MRSDIPDIAKQLPHATRPGGGVLQSSLEEGRANAEENVSPVGVSDRSTLGLPDLSDKGQGAPGRAPDTLRCLFNTAADLRPHFADAGERQDNIACHLLEVAFRIALMARTDAMVQRAIRDEAKRLGARPNSRSGIEHLAVDTAFGPQRGMRTRLAQALRGGIALDLTPEQFGEQVAKGSSGKGGIKTLAKIGREKKATNASLPPSTNGSPEPVPEPHLNADRRVPLREHGYLYAVLLTEEVRQSLLASDLKTGDDFPLLVRITPSNGLEGVRCLGAHRTSNRGGPSEDR